MPAKARKDVVREGEIGTYHTWSRCVQSAWLCGRDPVTGKDYEHRRDWIEKLLHYLAGIFAIDVGNYHILSNHLHAILGTRPDVTDDWSDEEAVWRWKSAWPTWDGRNWSRIPTDDEIEEQLALGPPRIAEIRRNLSSLSWFMACWKRPIALLANAEARTSGHFYEQRYGARELEDEQDLFAAMLYNDLQQVKAGVVSSLEDSTHSAFQRRFDTWKVQQAAESMKKFGRRKNSEDYPLSQEELEGLLDASWLSPISKDSPLLWIGGKEVVSVSADGTSAPRNPPQLILPSSYHDADTDLDGENDTTAESDDPPATDSELVTEAASPETVSPESTTPETVSPETVSPETEQPSSESREQPLPEQPTRSRAQRAADRTRRRRTTRIHERWSRRARRRPNRSLFALDWPDYYQLAKKFEARWKARAEPPPDRRPPDKVDDRATSSSWLREVKVFTLWTLARLQELPDDEVRFLQPRGDPG